MGGLVVSITTAALAQPEAPPPAEAPPPGAAAPQTAPPAYTPPPPPAYPPPPPPTVMLMPPKAPDPGRHLHDGFYLRTSLGLGPGKATENITGEPQYIWSGTALMFDVMIGGSPVPGFVLGGAFVYHGISNPTVKRNGSGLSEDTSDVSLNLATFGLFTAIYPIPTRGFNLHALLGYSQVSVSIGGNTIDRGNPSGPSFMGGVGYDFWISDNWSIGPDFRIAYCKAKYDSNGTSDEISMLIPTLSFTATYN